MNERNQKVGLQVEVDRLPDGSVDGVLDLEIRRFLQICFPEEAKFTNRRYYNEKPHMRWLIRSGGTLVAHIAGHSKTFQTCSRPVRFCGISEVGVVPDYRGCGYLSKLLNALEGYYAKQSYPFSILLGPAKIYTRYGYRSVDNIYFPDQSKDCAEFAMCKSLGSEDWPTDSISIAGPHF